MNLLNRWNRLILIRGLPVVIHHLEHLYSKLFTYRVLIAKCTLYFLGIFPIRYDLHPEHGSAVVPELPEPVLGRPEDLRAGVLRERDEGAADRRGQGRRRLHRRIGALPQRVQGTYSDLRLHGGTGTILSIYMQLAIF